MCGNTCQFRDSYITSANVCTILNTGCTAPGSLTLTLRAPLQSQFGPTFLPTSCKAAWSSQESRGSGCCRRCPRSPQAVVGQSRKAATQEHGCLGTNPAGAEGSSWCQGRGTAQAGPPQGICSLGMAVGTGGVPKCHPGFCRSQHLATAVNADTSKDAGL